MNNPASRLHNILHRARQSNLQNAIMGDAWREVFGIPKEDELAVMNKMAKLYALPVKVEKEIRELKDLDLNLYLGWKNDLTNALKTIHWGAALNNFSRLITDSLLINIRFCSHELEKRRPEKEIPQDELDSIKESVVELLVEVDNTDIAPDVKKYILEYLFKILDGVSDYQFNGATALEDTFNEAVGTIATMPELAKKVHEAKEGAKLWTILGRIDFILKLATDIPVLWEKMQPLLHHAK